MKYCPNCGSENIDVSEGTNNSQYIMCGDCSFHGNIYEDNVEEEKD